MSVPPAPQGEATAPAPPRRYRGSGRPGEPVDRRPGAALRVPPRRRADRRRERWAGRAWLLAWGLMRRLPERAAFALGDVAGRAAHRLLPGRRAVVRANLARAVSEAELDAAVRAAFRSYARYWVESFRVADMDPADLDRRTTTAGFEHLDAALERGRGVVVLLAHHGTWDVAARWAESHRYHLAVVAEVVRPAELFARFVRLREDIGLEVVPLRRGQDVTGRLAEVLGANHLVGLLTDRDLSGRAPVSRLFGGPTRVPMGPAVLSRRSGAPIVPITMLQRPGRTWHLQVLPAISTDDLTAREAHRAVVAALEALISLDPPQWHAFQPIYLEEGAEGDESAATGARR